MVDAYLRSPRMDCGNSRESWRSPEYSAIIPGEGFSEHAYDYLPDKSDFRSGHHIVTLTVCLLQSEPVCITIIVKTILVRQPNLSV